MTESDGDGEVIGTHKVAVKTGGTGGDAIAAVEEARNPPPPSPEQILADWRSAQVTPKTDFAVALANAGVITEAEAEGWLDGVLPGVVTTALDTLPEADRFAARMQIKGAVNVTRNSPLLALLAAVADVDDAALDALF